MRGLLNWGRSKLKLYALVGRRGAYTARYTAKRAKDMYAEGVRLSNTDILQVWETLDNGDLFRYDGARTRKLTDKIARSVTQGGESHG